MAQKRISERRQVLKKGEGQRSNGSYYFRWTDRTGKRHTIYSKSLSVLREREEELRLDDPNDLNGTYSYQDFTLDVESSYLSIYENGEIKDTLFVDGEVTIVMTEIDQTSGTATLNLAGTFTSTEGEIFEFLTTHSAEYDYYVTPDPQGEAVTNIRTDRQAIKSLKAGQLVIIKNGVKYNAVGAIVK